MREFTLSLPVLPPKVRTGLAWFTVVTSILAASVAGFALHRVGTVASEAKSAAAVSCVRTQTAGPYSTADAKRRGVYPPPIQEWLEKSIPTACPAVPESEKPPKFTGPWPPR